MPNTKTVEIGPRLYLNGFPKSGTHLLEAMAVNIVQQANDENNWMGNLDKSGFGMNFIHSESFLRLAQEMPLRRFLKGHAGWQPELAKAFEDNYWGMVFIYRDFRDVAVSMAYHAKKEDANFPDKEKYQDMEFDDLLKIVITGDGNIAGVMERWELFAPWLEEDWVLKLDFAGVINNKELACEVFLRYVFGRTGRQYGIKPEIDIDYYNKAMHWMMYRLNHPEKSPTYRKGKSGGWKTHFTDEHKALFKASDANNWLIKLEYEHDRDW